MFHFLVHDEHDSVGVGSTAELCVLPAKQAAFAASESNRLP